MIKYLLSIILLGIMLCGCSNEDIATPKETIFNPSEITAPMTSDYETENMITTIHNTGISEPETTGVANSSQSTNVTKPNVSNTPKNTYASATTQPKEQEPATTQPVINESVEVDANTTPSDSVGENYNFSGENEDDDEIISATDTVTENGGNLSEESEED